MTSSLMYINLNLRTSLSTSLTIGGKKTQFRNSFFSRASPFAILKVYLPCKAECSMARGILFIAGNGPAPERIAEIVQKDDVICAADGGLDTALACGIHPRFVVGDMDSLADRRVLEDLPPEAVMVYPEDKDKTDTEIGIAQLRQLNCCPIIIIGGGEGRLDHTLGLIKCFEKEQPPDMWYTAREIIRPLLCSAEIKANPGAPVSVYPLGTGPWRIESRGLHWEIDKVNWNAGAMSLSNRFRNGRVFFEVKAGRFLLILCNRPSSYQSGIVRRSKLAKVSRRPCLS
ncbi:MAG: thiamine diphosphokinase [Spirochaeta sp. LUC14_002_19_P3]|nr:MAG: thiamine diphosphokinase [Spirochaeta sp. LUC14_002_19_P3]